MGSCTELWTIAAVASARPVGAGAVGGLVAPAGAGPFHRPEDEGLAVPALFRPLIPSSTAA
jgi:hypothetical protein